jgi:hypothetical protein
MHARSKLRGPALEVLALTANAVELLALGADALVGRLRGERRAETA